MLESGVYMCNSLCGKELGEPSAISVSAEWSADQVACGSGALAKVLRARNPAIGTTRNARSQQSVMHVRTGHGTCYQSLGL